MTSEPCTRQCVPRGVELHQSNGMLSSSAPSSAWIERDAVLVGETQIRLMLGGLACEFISAPLDAHGGLLSPLQFFDEQQQQQQQQQQSDTLTHLIVSSNEVSEGSHRIDLRFIKAKTTDIVYQTRRALLHTLTLTLEFYADAQLVARCFVLGATMAKRDGAIMLPLIDADSPRLVGQLLVNFVVVTGHKPSCGADASAVVRRRSISEPSCAGELLTLTSRSLWKSSPSEDVGHRGSGARGARGSHGSRTWIAENTILSFNNASRNKLPFVEFDVQLTADGVPVIWHDFFIKDCCGHPMNVLDLTFDLFRNFRAHNRCAVHSRDRQQSASGKRGGGGGGAIGRPHSSTLGLFDKEKRNFSNSALNMRPANNGSIMRGSRSDDEEEDGGTARNERDAAEKNDTNGHGGGGGDDDEPHKFDESIIADKLTSLRDVFRETPITLGFDIELKYPNYDDKLAGARGPDRNVFVDAVLDVVCEFAHEPRRIFFSSFEPDICVMVHLKQTRYPVFLLTEAGTKNRNTCDFRTASLAGSVRFARRANLFGLVSRVTALLDDPSTIDFVKRSGLLLGSFGGENNELANVKLQEEHGVDLIVSDHIATLGERREELKRREQLRHNAAK